jgi:hypothetical protein
LRRIGRIFVEDCPGMLARIRKAIARGDAEALREEAHALKGSAANFVAPLTVEAAARLEVMGREGNMAARRRRPPRSRASSGVSCAPSGRWGPEPRAARRRRAGRRPRGRRDRVARRPHCTQAAACPTEDQAMNRILVVEDDRATRHLLQAVLEQAGFEVGTAKDGAGALKEVARRAFDLMLLDIWMPRMNGLEVLAKVKDMKARPRIVVMTPTTHPRPCSRPCARRPTST